MISNDSNSVVVTANSLEMGVEVDTIRRQEEPLEEVVDILDVHLLEIIRDLAHPHRGHHLLLVTVPTLDPEAEAMVVVVAAAMAKMGAAAAEVGVLMVEAVMVEVVEAGVTAAVLHLHPGAMERQRQPHQLEAMEDPPTVADLHMAVAVEHKRGHIPHRQATHLRPSIPEVLDRTVVLQVLGRDHTAVVVAVAVAMAAVIDVEFSHFGTLLGCLWPQARCASECARRVHFVVCVLTLTLRGFCQ